MSVSREVRDLVLMRAAFTCEMCAWRVRPLEIHHRRTRAMGSSRRAYTDAPCNLLALCSSCHRWVTEHPQAAREQGWSVSQYEDPSQVPIFVPRGSGRRVFLTNAGTFALEPGDPEPPGTIPPPKRARAARPSARVLRIAAQHWAAEHPLEWEDLLRNEKNA